MRMVKFQSLKRDFHNERMKEKESLNILIDYLDW